MKVLRKLFSILTSREKRNLYLLFLIVLIMAGLQVVSVASIMPFLSVASDPETINQNQYLNWAFNQFGFESNDNFLIFLGVASLFALIVSNTFIVFSTWALQKYIWRRNHSLSRRLLRSYLSRPYEYFLTRNSAELGKNVLEEVKEVTNRMLRPALMGVSKGIVGVFIIGFLVFVDPTVAVTMALVLGVSYGGIYFLVRTRIGESGRKRVEANTQRFQCVREALGGIKEVKLLGKESEFLNRYDGPSKRYADFQAEYKVITKVPRYALEAVAFGGIVLIAIYLIAARNSVQQVVPILGLYAFAGYRLMPALQTAFKGLTSSRFNLAALEELHKEMSARSQSDSSRLSIDSSTETKALPLKNQLLIDSITFYYPEAEEPAIEDLTLRVPARTMMGFVGKTGSGKSTMMDLVLGLLRPQKGEITVDGSLLKGETLRRWQRNIGYVPQDIHLFDDNILRNIAFGVSEEDIDMGRVEEVTRRASIYSFITDELSEGWQSEVGEGGVRLSGGQRQRIGIARALYHDPSLLVLDEATSALDQSTEAEVLESIYGLKNDHTILLVSHRLSTVERADNICMLAGGQKVGEGTYANLKKSNVEFQSMVAA